MPKINERDTAREIERARESRGLALEFLYTGTVNPNKWSAEVTAGLGGTLIKNSLFQFEQAERFAENAVRWSEQSLRRLVASKGD
jgi:hypothetical protein